MSINRRYSSIKIFCWHGKVPLNSCFSEIKPTRIKNKKGNCFGARVRLNHGQLNTRPYSYIFEANSKRLNDFSLIGRKPNDFLQFKWKSLMVLKFKPKLNPKFMLKESKTIKIIKKSYTRGRLTQVKATCFLHIKNQEISIYYDSEEIHAIEYCFWLWCTFWASH